MHLDSSSNEERVGVEFYAHREVCVCVFSPPRRDSGIASGDQSLQGRACKETLAQKKGGGGGVPDVNNA